MQARYGDTDLVQVEDCAAPLAACILWMLEHPDKWLVDGEGMAWMWASEGTFLRSDDFDWTYADAVSPCGEGGIVLPCKPAPGSERADEE